MTLNCLIMTHTCDVTADFALVVRPKTTLLDTHGDTQRLVGGRDVVADRKISE